LDCVDAFMTTPFEGGRHERRVEKLGKLRSSNN
jgi:ribose 5-phosphate isomerase RpiB